MGNIVNNPSSHKLKIIFRKTVQFNESTVDIPFKSVLEQIQESFEDRNLQTLILKFRGTNFNNINGQALMASLGTMQTLKRLYLYFDST